MPSDSVAELTLASQTAGSGSSSNERGLESRVKERNGRFPGSAWSQEFSSSAQLGGSYASIEKCRRPNWKGGGGGGATMRSVHLGEATRPPELLASLMKPLVGH